MALAGPPSGKPGQSFRWSEGMIRQLSRSGRAWAMGTAFPLIRRGFAGDRVDQTCDGAADGPPRVLLWR